MKTDIQFYRVFQAVPDWLFQLTGLPSPGDCTLQSFVIKALERRADGVVVPVDPRQPLTVVEFQYQRDDRVYNRIVVEMAMVQDAHGMRAVQGLILFRSAALDPRTAPWSQIVRTFALRDLLRAFERDHPRHPLVAVFQPLLMDDEERLRREAVVFFRSIKYSELAAERKSALADVFVSWLGQRLKCNGKKEMEAMLLDELPDLEETQLGQDLIQIGERRGWQQGRGRGLDEAIEVFLTAKHGVLPATLREQIGDLAENEAAELLAHLPRCQSLDDVAQWLASHPA